MVYVYPKVYSLSLKVIQLSFGCH